MTIHIISTLRKCGKYRFIIILIFIFALMTYKGNQKNNIKICYSNRLTIDGMLELFSMAYEVELYKLHEYKDNTFSILLNKGYIKIIQTCPSGGLYQLSLKENKLGYDHVTCSIHGGRLNEMPQWPYIPQCKKNIMLIEDQIISNKNYNIQSIMLFYKCPIGGEYYYTSDSNEIVSCSIHGTKSGKGSKIQ